MSTTEPDTGETTTPPPATGDTSSSEAPATGDTTDWQAEAEKWRALSRKNEERAKANVSAVKELEQLRQSSMTEQEKAVAEAARAAKAEAFAEFGQRLAAAEVRAEAAGRNVDADALLEGLDPSRFVTDDGEPDRKAIVKFLDGIAPRTPDRLDLGQGPRGDGAAASDMNSLLRRAAGR